MEEKSLVSKSVSCRFPIEKKISTKIKSSRKTSKKTDIKIKRTTINKKKNVVIQSC